MEEDLQDKESKEDRGVPSRGGASASAPEGTVGEFGEQRLEQLKPGVGDRMELVPEVRTRRPCQPLEGLGFVFRVVRSVGGFWAGARHGCSMSAHSASRVGSRLQGGQEGHALQHWG